jgi:hypothetical protein
MSQRWEVGVAVVVFGFRDNAQEEEEGLQATLKGI